MGQMGRISVNGPFALPERRDDGKHIRFSVRLKGWRPTILRQPLLILAGAEDAGHGDHRPQ